MQLNRKKQTASPLLETTSVNQIVNDLLDALRPRLNRKNISLESDLEPTSARTDSGLIHLAMEALLDNAIEAMPHGGVLTTTLIDGQHQWEFEVADTSGLAYSPFEPRVPSAQNADLPVIIPFPETEQLRDAYRNASKLGGQIQTWDCPQGGTAHVLVIPRRPTAPPQGPGQPEIV